MEFAKEMLILFGRIISILPLLLIVTLFMGKRSIGELPVFDFLVIISLGAVVGADIADPKIEHIHTAVAILMIGIFQVVMSKWSIRNRKIGRWVTFEPTLVIHQGQFLIKNMTKIRYSIDNILLMLRENNIFDVSEVELAIVEANGKLTVQKKRHKMEVTIEDMGIQKVSGGFSYPVIMEGKIYNDVLATLNLTHDWLIQHLKQQGLQNETEVFFASINERHEIHISRKNPAPLFTPPIHH